MTSAMWATDRIEADSSHRVELSLDADAELLFLARMTGAAVASRAEFPYERVEDLRLALDELCVRLMSLGSGAARIVLTFQWNDEGDVVVTALRVTQNGTTTDNHRIVDGVELNHLSVDLSERILDALVDEHGVDMVGEVHRAWLRMNRREPLT